jgi:DNA-binding GntR family transcriptional regulator
VRVPTRTDVQGHYVLREALESQAAMLFSANATRDERSELMKLAMRVDALSVQPEGNRFVYLSLHEKLHRRIAECARCSALSDAISRTSALASTWLCATRAPTPGNPPAHHENLLKVLVGDDPAAAAEAMRRHIRSSLENAMRRLEPFFQLQKVHPQTYSRTPGKRLALESLMEQSSGPGESAAV